MEELYINNNNRWAGIDRREFIKVSVTSIAAATGLSRFGKAQTMANQDSIKPFKIEVSEGVLNDLRERLARTRFPDQIENAGWSYGTDLSYLKELCAYWRSGFDWRAQERALNRFDHFRTDIEGFGIHFIHQRSKEKNAFPLLITHDWPGSFVEFIKIIGPPTNPAAYGGHSEDAFHVICPSIPGYGFSEAPRKSGFGCKQVAEILVELMARLGYTQYGAQGGDWCSYISTWIAALDTPHVNGLHLNVTVANPPEATADAGEKMSPRNCGVFQLLKEVITFLAFPILYHTNTIPIFISLLCRLEIDHLHWL